MANIVLYGLYRLYRPYRPMSEKPAARAMILPSKSCCGCRFSIGKPHARLVVGGWLVVVVVGWLVVGGWWLAGGGWLAGRAGA